MISRDAAARIDARIDESLTRLRSRAATHSPTLGALAAATADAAQGGKRMRPSLVVAAFEAFGGDTALSPAVWDVAAAFELLHSAFVVHDDVIDRDTERRGRPNVAGVFEQRARETGAREDDAVTLGRAAAVLAGDLLLFESARILATAAVSDDVRTELLDLLDDAVLRSAGGELRDVEHVTVSGDASAEELLLTAHEKTAVYSFEAPVTAGALLAGAAPTARVAAATAAGGLGLAFQLVDDLIGTFGSAEQAGRAPGADLRETKRTTLIALAETSELWPDVSAALALAPTGPIAIRTAQQHLEDSGARERLTAVITQTLSDAERTAGDSAVPPRVRALLHEVADRIRRRIP